jgi:two-component system sensor histidine kinase/response regulator
MPKKKTRAKQPTKHSVKPTLKSRDRAEEDLKESISLLQATLEFTADGILVVDKSGKITSYNRQFTEMWRIPDEVMASRNDDRTLDYVLEQLKDPEAFISKVRELYAHPDESSFDFLEFKDGKIFERYSQAQRVDGNPVGRVWSFRDVTLHKKAEQEIRLLAQTIASTQDCVSVTDLEFRLIFVNEAFLQTYGYTREELLGRPISIVRSAKISSEMGNQILTATSTGGWSGELFHRRKDGSEFPVELRTSVVKDDNGKVIAMVGVARDITEQKQVEDALRKSEERMRAIVEGTPHLFFYTQDINANTTYVSPTVEQLTGYKADIWIKRKDWFVTAADFNQAAKEKTRAHLRGEFTKEPVLLEVCHANGNRILLEAYEYPILQEGKIVGLQGVAHDITKRERSVEALRESEERYRQLIETMQDGVYRSSHEGKFLDVNPALVKILGYSSKEQLMAIDIKKQLYFDLGDRESAELEEKLEEMAVYRIRKKDGSEIWVEDHGRLVTDENGKVLYHEGVLRDVTERKRAEDTLEKSTREREKLIQELQSALDNVKTLQGLIPICANCKKIRDDKGYWNQVEEYIMEHSDATFTHGICPECAKKIFGEMP